MEGPTLLKVQLCIHVSVLHGKVGASCNIEVMCSCQCLYL